MRFAGNYKNKLMAFERKGLRRIFGPTKQRNGTWRIKRNDEYNKSHKSTKNKLVWPFTSNTGRENSKKRYTSENRC